MTIGAPAKKMNAMNVAESGKLFKKIFSDALGYIKTSGSNTISMQQNRRGKKDPLLFQLSFCISVQRGMTDSSVKLLTFFSN